MTPLATEGTKEALLFLGTAGLVVPLFRRLRLSPVLGFLIAGALLGPFGLGRLARDAPPLAHVSITSLDRIGGLAELGVVFLLFMIGLELSFERLKTMRRLVFGLGALQVGVSVAVLGGIALALGQGPAAAAILGAALALSSTALVIPVLAERKRLATGAGRACFSVLLFQDLAVAPLLAMVTLLDAREGAGLATGLLAAFAPAALAVAAIIGLGRLVLRPLFRHVAEAGTTETFMAACLLVVVGTGMVTAAAGQSMALGAFLAGLLLAETEYRHEVEVTIEPFKGLLLGLFFVAVGAELDLGAVAARPLQVLGVAAGFMLVKTLVVLGLARLLGVSAPAGREAALLLGPGGEFAFVLIGAGLTAGLVPPEAGATAIAAATLSMLLVPLLARWGEGAARRAAPAPDHGPPPPEGAKGHVLVVGYGRVGRLVGEMLDRHGIPHLALDSDARLVALQRKAGRPVHYGDATRADLLRRCGIDEARALVVTMDGPQAAERVVAVGRAARPDLTIVARARDTAHAATLYALGVTDAVPETVEASLQLSEAVLVDIGVPMGLVIASIHERRDAFRRALQAPGEERPRRAIRAPTRSASGDGAHRDR